MHVSKNAIYWHMWFWMV